MIIPDPAGLPGALTAGARHLRPRGGHRAHHRVRLLAVPRGLHQPVRHRRRRQRPGDHAGQHRLGGRDRRVLRLAASVAAGTPVSLSDALTGIDERNATLAIQAVARAAGQTWLTSAMMTDLADLLTVLGEFLRSSHEVTALLERFLAGRG